MPHLVPDAIPCNIYMPMYISTLHDVSCCQRSSFEQCNIPCRSVCAPETSLNWCSQPCSNNCHVRLSGIRVFEVHKRLKITNSFSIDHNLMDSCIVPTFRTPTWPFSYFTPALDSKGIWITYFRNSSPTFITGLRKASNFANFICRISE